MITCDSVLYALTTIQAGMMIGMIILLAERNAKIKKLEEHIEALVKRLNKDKYTIEVYNKDDKNGF